jgi:hypothetical protein
MKHLCPDFGLRSWANTSVDDRNIIWQQAVPYFFEKKRVHPRNEYANEKNARLVLNLAMLFFQHCI